MRWLARVSGLVLFAFAVGVGVTAVLQIQAQLDQQAELLVKGLATPPSAIASLIAATPGGPATPRATATVSLSLHRPNESFFWNGHPIGPSDFVRAEPALEQGDPSFTAVKVTRPGAEPSVHRVPRE